MGRKLINTKLMKDCESALKWFKSTDKATLIYDTKSGNIIGLPQIATSEMLEGTGFKFIVGRTQHENTIADGLDVDKLYKLVMIVKKKG